jgi:multimeric flavodoxin WrbA
LDVLAISGSARRGGNTALLLGAALEPLESAGHACQFVELAGMTIGGCTACMRCTKELDGQCHGRSDDANSLVARIQQADALILGSPVYFADVTPEMKALIDRTGYVSRANGNTLARKPGAAVVAVRRAGAMHAFDTLNHFFLIGEMLVVGSSYWNIGIGRAKGDVADDEEGMATMQRLGENIAWVLERLGR